MPAGKRKLELFDPNKSDPDDENYESGQDKPARRPSRKSKSGGKRSSGSKRRRTTYGGSDISDEDASDSLLEESFEDSEDSEEEEDMDPVTGRRKRQATKKGVNYEEASDEELDEKSETSEDDIAPSPNRPRPSRVVKLKVPSLMGTPVAPARSSRAGSTARGRGGVSTEPTSTVPRRSTRAHTEEGDELIALSNSGRHVIRSSKSPEALVRARQSRGGKSLKAPASIIKEEEHETSSYEQAEAKEDLPVDTEMTEAVQVDAGADVADAEGEPDEDELVLESTQYAQVAETSVIPVDDEDDEDEDVPVTRRTRASRTSISAAVLDLPAKEAEAEASTAPANRRLTRKSSARKTGIEQSSDFEPVDESGEEEISASDASPKKDDYDSERPRGRRAAQGKSKSTRSSRRRNGSDEDGEDEIDEDEVLEEALELKAGRRSRRAPRDNDILYERPSARVRKPVDYTIKQLDTLYAADEEGEDITATPSRKPRGGRGGASQPWERPLYTTFGPFGGAGGPPPVIGGPWGTGATGGVDSDSSDDEGMQRPSGIGGNVGMTPTSAMPGGLLPGMGQTNPMDPAAATGGTPANFGKVKSQKALADADPLGVDQDVDFSKVGGLEGHIDQLKEMVQMPLLYPELFLKFHVTPPRGVLFHGPPGTGKTLLARALAASVGSGGRKITFYMRKGADALSKWVGEAERQLRLLFEEARKTQPSIIFFDEIDGLAPVRSSKQEQIHASIVSTLLALMDGMDGRGQVIVIGATNRPDNIDPALRRPGRFDREFYFPLPGIDGRKSIINIHTRDWGIDEAFKDSLAQATKGYGGADLRALCTEAALNAIQRTYPQIYSSNDKLIVDPDKIKITAKDFMLSIKKMIPSSERATSSGAAPLPKVVEPLLRDQLKSIESILDGLIPIKKKVTALQEAMFEQYEDEDQGFGRETLQQDFEKSRVFRPRLLIGGEPGMGQSYLGAALLNHFEGLHVQNFDLPTIYADSARVSLIKQSRQKFTDRI
jgi:SpoVK/Ycf46/Vps4 family AAA+-type ATPase